MPIDPTPLKDPVQEFRARLCVMPVFNPSVSLYHDGDTGTGHTPTFYDVPIMGPNRIGMVGVPVDFFGGESYQRGGAAATGHTWEVYAIDPLDPEGVTSPGTSVAGPTASTNFSWTPSATGTYRVELRLANRHTTKNSDGFRFVRVFADDLDADLQEAVEFRGTGSVDRGYYEMTVTYKPTGAAEEVLPWSRVILNVDTYWSGSLNTFDTGGDYRVPSVQFNGIVGPDSISVNRQTEEITFTMLSPAWTLQKVQIRGYERIESQSIGDPPVALDVPIQYPLFFADPTATITLPNGDTLTAVEKVHEAKADFPVHEIGAVGAPMTITDPVIHVLQMHLNYMKWFDVRIDQETVQYRLPVSFSISTFWDNLKNVQNTRLGELYSDKKGTLIFQIDLRFQDEAVWVGATPEMTFDNDTMITIQATGEHYRVCQVQLIGIDPNFIPYFSRFPAEPDFRGEPYKKTVMLAPDKETLDAWSERLYIILNQPYSVTLTPLGQGQHLELNDMIGIDFTDPAGHVTL